MIKRTPIAATRAIGYLLAGLLVFLLPTQARAAVVDHSGTLAADEVWSGADVHRVTGTLTVPEGVSLTIEPGAVVKFSPYVGLTINGRLHAVGASGAPITFTSHRDDETGGDTNGDGLSSGIAGDWGGIRFNDSADDLSRLEQVQIRYGGYGGHSLNIFRANPTVVDSTIRDGSGNGIYVYAAAPVVTGATVSGHAGVGIYLYSSSVDLLGNQVQDNAGTGIYVPYGAAGRIENNTITDNGGYGLHFGQAVAAVAPRGNSITGNAEAALRVPFSAVPNASDGNTLSPNGRDTVEILGNARSTDLNLAAGPVYWLVDGTATIDAGASLTLAPGTIVKFSLYTGLTINGRLDAVGASGAPITFTSYRDDEAGGDTNEDGQSSGAAGDWGAIRFNDSADDLSRLEQVQIRYGGYGGHSLNIFRANPTVVDSTIRDGSGNGIYVYAAAPVVTGATVSGHAGVGIYLYSSSVDLLGNQVQDNAGTGVYVGYGAAGRIENNTITDNGGYGLYFGQAVAAAPPRGNSIIGNAEAALRVPFSAVPNASDGNTLSPNERDTVEILGNRRDTDLDLAAGPVYWLVSGTATVDPGASLTPAPGAILKFGPYTGLTINGHLQAVGTSGAPIIFTSYRDDEVGGDTNGDGQSSGAAGDWHAVGFGDSADDLSRLEQVQIRYGGYGGSNSLNINRANPTIAESTIRDGSGNGIYVYAAAPVITGVTVSGHAAAGIYLHSSPAELLGNRVHDNAGTGVYVPYGVAGRIENNTITDNGGYGLYFGQAVAAAPPRGNSITGNAEAALRVPFSAVPNASDGNTLSPNGRDTVEILGNRRDTDLDLAAGPVYWLVDGTATIDAGASLTLAPGTIVKFSLYTGLTINGRLDAVGASGAPITFTSYRDDEAGGDTNGDGPSSGVAGDWSRIVFRDSADDLSRLEWVEIRYGGNTGGSLHIYRANPTIVDSIIAFGRTTGIELHFASPSISTSHIWGHRSNGIYIYDGTPTLEYCEISSNRRDGIDLYHGGSTDISDTRIFANGGLGIDNRSGSLLSAVDTWWGDTDGSGPYHPQSNPAGTGQEVSDNVDYANFLIDAPIEYGYSNLQEGGVTSYGSLPPAVLNQGTLSNEWDTANAASDRTMAHDSDFVELGLSGLDSARSYKVRVSLFNGDAGYTAALRLTDGEGNLIAEGIRVPANATPTQYEFEIPPAYYGSGDLALRFVNDATDEPGSRVAVPELWIIEDGALAPALLAAVDYNDTDGSTSLTEGDQYRFRFTQPMDTTLIRDGTTDANLRLAPAGGLLYGTLNQVSWSDDQTTVTVTITADFTIAGSEQISLEGLFDQGGNPVDGTAELTLIDTIAPLFETVEWSDADTSNALSLGDTLTFRFSEAMDTAVIADGGNDADTHLALIGGGSYGTPNQVAWSADARSVTLTIAAGFDLQGDEIVDPRDSLTDVAGNPVLGTRPLGAIDQEPPRIESLRFDDRDGDGAASLGDLYLFGFSEPMYTGSLRDGTANANINLPPGTATYGTVNAITWNAEQSEVTVTLTSGATLIGGEPVTPSAAVVDLANNPVANETALTLVDTVPPRLESLTANAPDPVTPRSDYRLTLRFDGAMDPALDPQFALGGGANSPLIPDTGVWSTEQFPNDTYTTGDIAVDETHEATWSVSVSGATDVAGNAMQPAADAFSFRVVGVVDLTVAQFAPAPEVNHWNQTQVTLQGTRDPLTSVLVNGVEVAAPGTLNWSAQVALEQGTNNLTVTAGHTAGQTLGTVSLVFEVDTQPPPPPVVDPYPAETTLSVMSFSGNKEAGSGLWLNGIQVLAPDAGTSWQFSRALSLGLNSFQLAARDAAGNQSTPVTLTVTRLAIPDTGPELSDLRYDGAPLGNGGTLTQPAILSVNAVDDSGVSRVEFSLDGVMLGSDSNGGDGYAIPVDLLSLADGAHVLQVRAEDSLGNASELTVDVTVALGPPPAPILSAPPDGLTTNQASVTLAGSAMPGSEVLPYLNGVATGAAEATDGNGGFAASVTLAPGDNQIQASARHRGGEGPLSGARTVTLDDSRPNAPSGLSAAVGEGGQVTLTWTGAAGDDVTGYQLYRATASFDAVTAAVRINSKKIVGTAYDDLPPADGTFYYRVVAVNALGTESAPSNLASARVDTTAPRALSIQYAPQGASDPQTGRIAQGRVDIVLDVSEPLLTTPFLSLATDGGAPLAAVLEQTTDTRYEGFLEVTQHAGTGTAYAVFSARDLAGNRGTVIDDGATLEIDTKGPHAVRIDPVPEHPIRNDSADPVTLDLTLELDEPVGDGLTPELGLRPSLSGEESRLVPLSQDGDLIWRGSIVLPSSAGLDTPELLLISYAGEDDLGNQSTNILDTRLIQVYQGDLPPLEVPPGCSAEARPGGEVFLSWQSVEEAADYRIFRQAPGETELTPYADSDGASSYLDAPAEDGIYLYGVASVRAANDQESLSAPCAGLEVAVDALAPPPPTGLTLALQGAGIQAVWTAPVTDEAVTYQLYRDSVDPIDTLEGLIPVASGIEETLALDPAPVSGLYAYAVTALDAAGNESPPSNTAYLNFELLPVSSFTIGLQQGQAPELTWTHPSPAGVDYYDLYLGTRGNGVRLNQDPLYETAYTDTAYSGGERLYTLVAVDVNGNESLGRSLLLPQLALEPLNDGELLRGLMNRLQYRVTNLGEGEVRGARLRIGAGGREHGSEPFDLGPGQSIPVPVVVGGYADLSDPEPLAMTLDIAPNEGEHVTSESAAEIPVGDAGLTLAVAAQNMLRGGSGEVRFSLENSSQVELELITARAQGQADSDEILIKLLDADANVLATAGLRQALGSGVLTLANGITVARIPAGGRFTSDWVPLTIPSAAPDLVSVQVHLEALHYRYGQPDAVRIAGAGGRRDLPLVDTPYVGQLDSLTPDLIYAGQALTLRGRALSRDGGAPVAQVPLDLVLAIQGFERTIELMTDAGGEFSYQYLPPAGQSGIYRVSVVHPDLRERPEQGSFTVAGLNAQYDLLRLKTARNLDQPIEIPATAAEGSTFSGVRLAMLGADQPSGFLPQGISFTADPELELADGATATLGATFRADDTAAAADSLVLRVVSDQRSDEALASIRIDYELVEAAPVLRFAPQSLVTGVTQGGSVLETISLSNVGLFAAEDVSLALADPAGTVPPWMGIASETALGGLAVGEEREVTLRFAPGADVASADYQVLLQASAANADAQGAAVGVTVTPEGEGRILFKVEDIYTNTQGTDGSLIEGLEGARIFLQNEQLATVTATLTSGAGGEVLSDPLPAGSYRYRASAPDHTDATGRVQVRAGIVASERLFLDSEVVTVQWQVTETSIEDEYRILLAATYAVDVPTAVIALEPSAVALPFMRAGEVFYGELVLSNYGLISAFDVGIDLPANDPYLRYELLAENLPTVLEAKQRLVIPYRLTALRDLSADESGGGCFSYANSIRASGESRCVNGQIVTRSTSTSYSHRDTSSCPSGSGEGGGSAPGGRCWGDGCRWPGGRGGPGYGAPLSQPSGLPPCRPDGNDCSKGGGPGLGGAGSR